MDKHIITWDDVVDEIKVLVELGLCTKEEIMEQLCINEEENVNDDIQNISYATREQCEECYKNIANQKYNEQRKEDSKWKQIRVTFKLECDERYCYWNNTATIDLYVNKYWSANKIKDYVKKHIRISVCKISDGKDWYETREI